MMQGIKNTTNETFVRLMGNGLRYTVPRYQRDYSWTAEQWSDLWHDILQMLEDNDSHYMGYLVLQTTDDKNYQIIDGQQRLTTLCILILSIEKMLRNLSGTEEEKQENERRAQNIHASYIGNLDMMTLTSVNKLVLNRNNDNFYRNYLTSFIAFPSRGLKTSEKLLKNAFETFCTYLSKQYATAQELINFLEIVVNNIFFTVITVSDELNAFKVFETLNARGVQLSSSDLLKNYIFSVAEANKLHGTLVEEIEAKWAYIMDILRDSQISDFLRIYWNSTHKTVRKNQLYRTVREEIRNSEQAFSLLRDLERNAHVYMALKDPYDELWQQNPDIKENIGLLKLFHVSQPLSLLLSAYTNLSIEEFASLLSKIVVVSFRYNVICEKNPNEQEVVYNKMALEIQRSKSFDANELKTTVFISDSEFEQVFMYKEFVYTSRNNQIAKYILARLEKFESGASVDEADLTLEHILPDSPNEAEWHYWDDLKISQYHYRLGNMTLLEYGKNKTVGNRSFTEKKAAYMLSSVPMTKHIAEKKDDQWTEDDIEKRQQKMAAEAKGIWKF